MTPETPDPTDLLGIDSLLSAEEVALRGRVRAFVDAEIRPNIARWYDTGEFPRRHRCADGRTRAARHAHRGLRLCGPQRVEYGLAALEVEAGDSGLRTFLSVQGSLAMGAIARHGSEEQKNQWLPRMAAGSVIGCFALTEPGGGSDPASMLTNARRDGGDWVLNGTKRWIGLASIAQVAVVWAQTDDGIRGFLVPTDTPGFRATEIPQKLSMRASIQCDVELTESGSRPRRCCPPPGDSGARSNASTTRGTASCGVPWGRRGTATWRR
jgi:glutaryl-CoA dehydrogenase